jgi:hypothetical protein
MPQADADGVLTEARRRILLYSPSPPSLMIAHASVSRWSMLAFEGTRIGYIEALHGVVETFTTTGYGEDADRWATNGA